MPLFVAQIMNKIIQKTCNNFNEIAQLTPLKSGLQSPCNLGRLREAMKLVLYDSVQSDYFVFSNLLQSCIDAKARKEGCLIHSHLIINGYPSNIYLNTKLIIFYSKFSDMFSARNAFDKMPEKSVVSWTALLSGYAQNGESAEALRVFLGMRRVGVRANQFTYGSALRACTSLDWLNGGKQIQGCIEKSRFVENLFVQSALVDLHSKCGEMEDACLVFQMMSERDVVSWNAMIGGYAVQGFGHDAGLMFRSMLREGMVPDCFTLGSVLKTSTGGSSLTKVSQMHSFVVKLGLESNNILIGSLIDAYVKCRSMRSANNLYRGMLKKDTISCTSLITGYAHEGNCSVDALSLFSEARQMRMRLDDVILCSMLNICANLAELPLGKQMHAIALKYQPRHDVAMGNALIDMYSKSGEIEDANSVFNEMGEKNVISWTSLIAGYGRHGDGCKAVALYKKMQYEGLKPNDVTFLSLLFACSHNGLTNEGWECFSNMVTEYNILPRAEHYSCMVDLLARGGQLEEAYNLIYEMNIKPNASLWGAVLGACSIYGDMSLGEMAATHLLCIEPDKSTHYVVLSSIYAAAGLWDNAWKARQMMEDRSLRKDPGCSLMVHK